MNTRWFVAASGAVTSLLLAVGLGVAEAVAHHSPTDAHWRTVHDLQPSLYVVAALTYAVARPGAQNGATATLYGLLRRVYLARRATATDRLRSRAAETVLPVSPVLDLAR